MLAMPGRRSAIALRLTMGVPGHEPIRMAGVANMPVLSVAIRRRGLR